MHVHAERRLRAAERAGLVVLDRLVGRLHDPRGRDAEAVVQRLLDRFHALVEHVQIDARHLRAEAHRAAVRPAIGARSVDALGHRIGHEPAEAHVVAADRHQHDVDRALARLRRAPGLADALRANRGAAGVVASAACSSRSCVRGAAADADRSSWSSCARTLPPGISLCTLARIHSRNRPCGHFRARAGEARERHRAVAVLERELDATRNG